jgi:hypothetical protein
MSKIHPHLFLYIEHKATPNLKSAFRNCLWEKDNYSLTFAFPPSIIEIALKSGNKKLCHKAKEL